MVAAVAVVGELLRRSRVFFVLRRDARAELGREQRPRNDADAVVIRGPRFDAVVVTFAERSVEHGEFP